MPQDKKTEAQALQSLEDNPGWKIVKKMLEDSRATALQNLTNKKKANDMDSVNWYQSMYQHANNILVLIDNKIQAGIRDKAKDEQD